MRSTWCTPAPEHYQHCFSMLSSISCLPPLYLPSLSLRCHRSLAHTSLSARRASSESIFRGALPSSVGLLIASCPGGFDESWHAQVLGAGKTEGAMDAANMLKPMLARGELRCIGATTIVRPSGAPHALVLRRAVCTTVLPKQL